VQTGFRAGALQKAANAFAKAAFFHGLAARCGVAAANSSPTRRCITLSQAGRCKARRPLILSKNLLILWASARYRDQPYNSG
jgi:hypothetical protein